MIPKLVITDIDGIWTDGGMYYDQTGNEWKRFNTTDSAGVLMLHALHIPLAVITGEETDIVKRRAEKLGVDYLFQGVKDKLKTARLLADSLGITLQETAFIGDDFGDIHLLQASGTSACPPNVPEYVSKHAHFVTKTTGGQGAFREFVETILSRAGRLDEAVEKIITGIGEREQD